MLQQDQIREFLQDTDVCITLTHQSSVIAAEDYDIPVPEKVPSGMIVALLPPTTSRDKYWVAAVTTICQEEPLVYNVRYLQYNKTRKGWISMSGAGAYGWAPHSSILVAPVELNQNHSMKQDSLRRISNALQTL